MQCVKKSASRTGLKINRIEFTTLRTIMRLPYLISLFLLCGGVLLINAACGGKNINSNNANLVTTPPEPQRPVKRLEIKANDDAPGGPYQVTGDLAYASSSPIEQSGKGTGTTLQMICVSTSANVAAQPRPPLHVSGSEDAFELCFALNQNKRSSEVNTVSPATYYLSRDLSDAGRLGHVGYRLFLRDKEATDMLDPDHTYGPIKIDVSTPDRVAGSIAMSDQFHTISGEFDARINMH
jgi:hypothetical protein